MKKTQFLPILIIIVGSLLRIIGFLRQKSLTMDEANLARNIVELDYVDFFSPLKYDQYAPPLYLVCNKLLTSLAGVNEMSLTFISLFSSILSLYLIYNIAQKLTIGDLPTSFILLTFSFSFIQVEQAIICKQYAWDVCASLILVSAFLSLRRDKYPLFKVVGFAVLGSLLIWSSMPIVFSMVGIGVCMGIDIIHKRSSLGMTLLTGGLWVFSFVGYFFLILHQDIGDQNLQNFHEKYFFNLWPDNWSELQSNLNILKDPFLRSINKTTLSILLGCVMYFIGQRFFWRKDKGLFYLFLLPFLSVLTVSGFHYYSMIPRLNIFLHPFILLPIGLGVNHLLSLNDNRIKYTVLFLLCISLINTKGYEYFWNKFDPEPSKQLLSSLASENKAHKLFINIDAVPAFTYYNDIHDDKFNFRNVTYENSWKENPVSLIQRTSEQAYFDRFIFLNLHSFPKDIAHEVEQIKSIAILDSLIENNRQQVYYFRLKQTGR